MQTEKSKTAEEFLKELEAISNEKLVPPSIEDSDRIFSQLIKRFEKLSAGQSGEREKEVKETLLTDYDRNEIHSAIAHGILGSDANLSQIQGAVDNVTDYLETLSPPQPEQVSDEEIEKEAIRKYPITTFEDYGNSPASLQIGFSAYQHGQMYKRKHFIESAKWMRDRLNLKSK